jgi:S-DNA-T family DNA segregation ATPase FtsK/SpoIIIE
MSAAKKRSSDSGSRSTTSGRSTSGRSTSGRSYVNGRPSTSKGRGAVRDATPPGTPTTEVDPVLGGQTHEFIGLGLIGAGILFGLALYLGVAGPVGRALESALGWFVGLGRYALPAALVAAGVSLVRRGTSANPTRLLAGWLMVLVASLGLLDVVNGPTELTADADELEVAGGFVGMVVAQPLVALVNDAGAAVVLGALLLGGLLVITRTSLLTMATSTGGLLNTVLRPIGRAAKSGLSSITSLSSDRTDRAGDDEASGATVYDFAAEDAEEWSDADAPPKRQRGRRQPAAGDGATGPAAPVRPDGTWVLPPLSFLDQPGEKAIDRRQIEARGQMLQESLASHGVETTLVGMTAGPTVTRYELELGAGVKVARVTSLQKDIAYAMAAVDVRILAPIPGRSAIGVEVPNTQRQLVALGDLLASNEAKRAAHPLDVAVGKDIAGRAVFLDLASTPHLLIAGATGAGKSSGINCIITSLLMRSTPDEVRLILIDPKQVEMGQYQRLPHLLTQPVTNPKKAANALGWAVKEMERRYDVLSEVGYRDVTGYNAAVAAGTLAPPSGVEAPYEHLPFIVVVVDELNDLMMVASRDVEESITRIAQKARAVGIHLIVATQRPSVNVITGVIKANIPARMAFAVSSLTDSRVILDQPGAEKLVGKGDMLLLPGNSSVANRIQGSFVSEDEVRRVVAHWRAQAPEPVTSAAIEDGAPGVGGPEGGDEPGGGSPALVPRRPSGGGPGALGDALDVTSDANAFSAGDDDEDAAMMRQAMELVVRSQLGSTSMLQRKLKVGFARAGRIMDLLEQRGVVGPSEGSKARAVRMTVEEFELLEQNHQL